MLKCEGLTIRQLRDQYADNVHVAMKDEDDTHDNDVKCDRIDGVVTRYLNDKPGTWTLISATTNNFGWYFIWAIPD